MRFDSVQKHKLEQAAGQICARAGFLCRTLEWLEDEKILRIYIESAHKTEVTIEECAAVTKEFEKESSFDELIPGSYQLEVSSLGIEKPLAKSEHFRLGQEVEVTLFAQEDGQKSGRGSVAAVEDDKITLKTSRRQWSFPLSGVRFAKEVANWDEIFRKGGVNS